jgi:hypothetical protein
MPYFKLAATVLATLLLATEAAAQSAVCVKVEAFTSDTTDVKTKADKRAAQVPDEVVKKIQDNLVLQVPLSMPGSTGVAGTSGKCPAKARVVVLSGVFADYKEGNRAMRYWVGMGAGKQKFSVNAKVVDEKGATLGEEVITDRKIGGLVGGSDAKGLEDFSEKVIAFVKTSTGAKK